MDMTAPFPGPLPPIVLRPPCARSVSQHCVRDAKPGGKVPNGNPLTPVLYEYRAGLVALLNFRRRPTAIIRAIAPVIIHAVKGVPSGAFAHVRQEIIERTPALANGDAPPSVGGVFVGFRIGAALPHLRPRIVSRRLVAVAGMPMRGLAEFAGTFPRAKPAPPLREAPRVCLDRFTAIGAVRGDDGVPSSHPALLAVHAKLTRPARRRGEFDMQLQDALEAGGWG